MINNVSDTAFWVANYRAVETERPDALFHDPLAERLSGEYGRKIAASMPSSAMTEWSVVIRTVIIDAFIRDAVASGTDTVLNLGAGLDTRPYRLDVPASLRWIEVDYPAVIDFKESELARETPRCTLERVRLDLTDIARRREFLASVNASARQVLVLTEGVIPYLTVDDVAVLSDDLRAVPHVAHWIVDYFSPQVARMRGRSELMRKLKNAPFRFDPPDWLAFFLQRGWRVREERYLAQESLRLKRPIPLPRLSRLLFALTRPFMKAEQMRQAGYILLERA